MHGGAHWKAIWRSTSRLDRPRKAARGAPSEPSRALGVEKAPEATKVDPSWSKTAPEMVPGIDFHRFWEVFPTCLVSKSCSKRLRRSALRSLVFEGASDDGFVDFARCSVEFAFSLPSRRVWFYIGKTMLSATSLG